MHFSTSTLALALLGSAHAHTRMWSVWVNGKDQGDGRDTYIRSPPNNNPVKDLSSADLVCNVNGGNARPKFVTAVAGDKLSFEWYHDNRNDDIIDASHKGPIITYVAPYAADNGASPIWTKIAEDGYSGTWAVEKLIAAGGKADFTIPSSLKAGKYLIRQEIIALHESDTAYNANPARGAQFYPSCVQFEITGSGSAAPSENFDFNTGYTYADPGIVFNLYNDAASSYKIPGPAVWNGSGSASTPAKSSAAVSAPVAASSAVSAPTAGTSAAATIPAAGASTAAPAPTVGGSSAIGGSYIPTPTTLSTLVRPSASVPAAEPSASAPAEGDDEYDTCI